MAVPRRTLLLLRKLANQVGSTTDSTVRALTGAWAAAWDDLSPAWQQGIAVLAAEYRRTGRWPAVWQVARIEAIARAQEKTEQALTVLVGHAAAATRQAASEVSQATLRGEPAIIGSQQRDLAISVPAVQAAGALGRRQARITALHAPLPASAMAAVRQVYTRPPAGLPADTGQLLFNRTRAGFETALVRAATVARTELVDTYRTASQLVHLANAPAVTGWCWLCTCDVRSCTACWALHGRRFPAETAGPEGHPACRCQRAPMVGGNRLPTAERRFRRLTRRDQIAVLGPGRWQMWQSGQLGWDDLAMQRSNPGWRDSWTPTPVAGLRQRAGIRT